MSYQRLIEYHDPREELSDLFEILVISDTKTTLQRETRALHELTDKVYLYRTSETVIDSDLPSLMASLLQRRENVKQIYREILNSRVRDHQSAVDEIFEELENELYRSHDMLSLYPRRGLYH